MITMSNAGVQVESNSMPPRATTSRRGLSVVDVFLVLAANSPTMLSWLHVEMLKRNLKYSKRALQYTLNKLVDAGYVVHERRYYALAPTISTSSARFFPPVKPGIAEVDLLLLVLAGVKEPRRPFLMLWGGNEAAELRYRRAVRRLVQLGYLERRYDRRYLPSARTLTLLNLKIV